MRIAVIVHLFHADSWPQLRACIRNITGAQTLIVTYVDERAVAQARRDFPSATFLPCENRGYDIWPFLKALRTIDLAQFDLVVKLHTKRDVDVPFDLVFNNTRFNGPAWRTYLLSFCATKRAWAKTVQRFRKSTVGMVADRHVIIGRDSVPPPGRRPDGSLIGTDTRDVFDAAAREMTLRGTAPADCAHARFVAGTMFVVRAEVLTFLAQHDFSAEAFDEPEKARRDGIARVQLAHLVERMFGLAVAAHGLEIAAWNGNLALRDAYYNRNSRLGSFLRFWLRKKLKNSATEYRLLHLFKFTTRAP